MVPERSKQDVAGLVDEVSQAAFELSKQVGAVGGKATDDDRARARDLDRRLDELVPLIESVSDDRRPQVESAWTDGRMDVGYVLSDGNVPTSIRLHHALPADNR